MRFVIHKGGKKEYINILLICLVFIALAIFVGNTDNADFHNLEYRYLNGNWSNYSDNPGVYIMAMIFRKIGFSYFWFHAFEAIFGIVLLTRFLKKYSDSPSLIFLLYMIYPFFLDVVQIDNFLSYVILLNGIPYLEENNRKGIYKYILITFIAALVHGLVLIYLLFLLINVKNVKTVIITIGATTALLYFNIRTLPNLINVIPLFKQYSNQLSYYLAYKAEFQHGATLYVILTILLVLVGFVLYRRSVKMENVNEHEIFLLKLMAVSICFSVFILIHGEFVRVIRNVWVIYYCYFSITKEKKLTIAKNIFLIAFAMFLFIHELSYGTYYYNNVTEPILNNNLFW